MTSYSRPIFDVDFAGLPDAATWPAEYFKAVTVTAGASASVASGWGVIDLGTNTGYTSQVLHRLWAYPVEGDKFDLLVKVKIISPATADPWIDFHYRATDNPSDYNYNFEFAPGKYQLDRATGFSHVLGPVVTQSWAANTVIWGRLRVVGDKHAARVWLDGATEPQTWPTVWMDNTNARVGRWFVNAGASGSPTHAQIALGRISIREIGDVYEPITSNRATATFSGTGAQTAFVIPHMMDAAPTTVDVTPGSSAAAGVRYVTYDATNITVTYTTAPASGTGNVILNWRAEV